MDPRHQAFPGQRILWMWEKRIAWRNSSLGQKQLTAANPATPGPAHREQRETVMYVCVCVCLCLEVLFLRTMSRMFYTMPYTILFESRLRMQGAGSLFRHASQRRKGGRSYQYGRIAPYLQQFHLPRFLYLHINIHNQPWDQILRMLTTKSMEALYLGRLSSCKKFKLFQAP